MVASVYRRAFVKSAIVLALSTGLYTGLVLETRPVFAQEQATASNYLNSKILRQRALDALFKKIGTMPPVSSISISPDAITLLTQSKEAAYYTDAWTVSRVHLLLVDQDWLGGPTPSNSDGLVAKTEGSFFALSDIALDDLETVVESAIGMAGMETAPEVTSLTIARAISILPEPSYGEVRWTVSLSTGRETATIYANGGGTIIGADLAGTTRAQRLDMVADDNWPMQQAQDMLGDVLGTAMVHRLSVSRSSVSVDADHPTDKKLTRDYSWDLSGVRRGIVDMPNMTAMGMGSIEPFAISEIDLNRLPEIKAAALAAFGSPDARITSIDANKPTDRAGKKRAVLWSIDLKQADGEEGEVLVGADAQVVEIHLPESRMAAAGPWLAPVTIVQTLARMEKEFGADARFTEITIDDRQAQVNVEDPQQPGAIAQFIMDAREVSRFGTPMPWEAEVNQDRTFTLADIKSLGEERLGTLSDDTLKQMNLDGAAVYRYTISRGVLMMEPDDNRLLVEIRAGKDNGWKGGWVVYDMDGKQVDIMTP